MINLFSFFWSQELVAEHETHAALAGLRGGGWQRLARRELSRSEITTAIRSIRPGRLRAGAQRPVERSQAAQVSRALDHLRDRGTEALLLLSQGEPLYDRLARGGQLDALARWPNLSVERIPSTDHMFRAFELQRLVHASLDRVLDRVLAAPPTGPVAGGAPTKPDGRVPEGQAAAEPGRQRVQATVNAALYSRGSLVRTYAKRDLRPVEVMLLVRYRAELSHRVLELGCGAGRVTGYLGALGGEVVGVDVSAAMVSYCRRAYPQVTFGQQDLRDLSGYATRSFDTVWAPFNVLDVLDDEDRRAVLDEIGRVLTPDGLLIMSSHNRAAASQIRGPAWVFSLDPLALAANLVWLPRSLRNRRRLAPLQRDEPDYAILNDCAHSFGLLHYYVSRTDQARRLSEQGFDLLECLDLDGRLVEAGDDVPECSELHYVARRSPGAVGLL
jgi:SAM-dependent methyltransferase